MRTHTDTHIHTHTYIHRLTDTHTDRHTQTDRHTHTLTDTHAHTHTDRQTDTHTHSLLPLKLTLGQVDHRPGVSWTVCTDCGKPRRHLSVERG